jgi:hypothetical protein
VLMERSCQGENRESGWLTLELYRDAPSGGMVDVRQGSPGAFDKAVWWWPPVGAADAGPMQIQLWEGREVSGGRIVLGSKTHHPMRTEVG